MRSGIRRVISKIKRVFAMHVRQVYTERKGHGQVDILWMLKQYDGWIKGAGQKNSRFKRFNLKHTNTNQKCTVCLTITMPLPDDYFL